MDTIQKASWLIATRTAANGKRIFVLQSWPEYFDATKSGVKRHEIRDEATAGITFAAGDYLALFEYDPDTQKYTGDMVTVQITYISPRGKTWQLPGYAYMSIRKCDPITDLPKPTLN